MARLVAGDDFEAAVLATTGLTLDRFEEAWQRAVRRRYSLVTWLLAGGGWLLVALGVLGLVHFRRRADRDAPSRPRRWVGGGAGNRDRGPELDPTRDRW